MSNHKLIIALAFTVFAALCVVGVTNNDVITFDSASDHDNDSPLSGVSGFSNEYNVAELIYKKNSRDTVKLCGATESFRGVLVVPDSVTIEGKEYNVTEVSGFENNVRMTGVVFGKNVAIIDGVCFKGCLNLDGTVQMPASMKNIGESAFADCTKLDAVVFNEGLEIIAPYAFQNCTSLNEIDLPSTLKNLCEGAFDNCRSLKGEVVLPEGITVIHNYVFRDTEISGLVFEGDVVKIQNAVLVNCRGHFESLVLPSSVKCVCNSAFYNASIDKLVIPDGVDYIEYGAFANTHLKELEIGNDIASIHYNAFLGNTFYLSDGTTKITPDDPAFQGNKYIWSDAANGLVQVSGGSHLVTYYANGGDVVAPAKHYVNEGMQFVLPDYTGKKGDLHFAGWYYYVDEKVYQPGESIRMLKSDIVMIAVYGVNVSFDLQGRGGLNPETQLVYEGYKVTPFDDPVQSGYTFVGWFTEPDTTAAEKKWDIATGVPTKDMTLYAGWVKN